MMYSYVVGSQPLRPPLERLALIEGTDEKMSVVEPLPLRLDVLRGGWLTADETMIWDEFQAMPLDEIAESDVVAVFGAAGGGIAAYVWKCRPAHMILVEADKTNRRLLEMTWRDARGVSIMDRDPVQALPEILAKHLPSIAVLNLTGRETEPEVVQVLARPNASLDILCIRYAKMSPRARALHEMLLTWHEGTMRWRTRKHDGPSMTRLYVR